MQRPERDHLFVYGTLLTSAEHPLGRLLRDKARLVGHGSINARLYLIEDPDDADNSYPGAVPSANPEDRVHGELYEVLDREPLLEALDSFEACSPDWPEPHEFVLRAVEVSVVEDGEGAAAQRPAMAYLYSWDVSSALRVPSGRFDAVAPTVR